MSAALLDAAQQRIVHHVTRDHLPGARVLLVSCLRNEDEDAAAREASVTKALALGVALSVGRIMVHVNCSTAALFHDGVHVGGAKLSFLSADRHLVYVIDDICNQLDRVMTATYDEKKAAIVAHTMAKWVKTPSRWDTLKLAWDGWDVIDVDTDV